MPLDGKQIKRLQHIFLAAFPTLGDLRQMVFFGLNENLNGITASTNLAEATFELLVWAQSRQRMPDLIDAALGARPENAALQEFAALVRPPEAAPPASPPLAPSAQRLTLGQRRELYRLLNAAPNSLRRWCILLGVPFGSLEGQDRDSQIESLLHKLDESGRRTDVAELLAEEAAQAAQAGPDRAEQKQAVPADPPAARPVFPESQRFEELTTDPATAGKISPVVAKKNIIHALENRISQQAADRQWTPSEAQLRQCVGSDWELDRIVLYLYEEYRTGGNLDQRILHIRHEFENLSKREGDGRSLMPLYYALRSLDTFLQKESQRAHEARAALGLFQEIRDYLNANYPALDAGGETKARIDQILDKLSPA